MVRTHEDRQARIDALKTMVPNDNLQMISTLVVMQGRALCPECRDDVARHGGRRLDVPGRDASIWTSIRFHVLMASFRSGSGERDGFP